VDEIYVSAKVLEKLTMLELVNLHNSLAPPRQISKFSSIIEGVQCCLALLAERGRRKADKRAGRPRQRIDRPFLGNIREPRNGTKRAAVLNMLRCGITREEMQLRTGWTDIVLHNLIMAIHKEFGYGLIEDAAGAIFLIEE